MANSIPTVLYWIRDKVPSALFTALHARSELGIRRYGRPLQAYNGRNAVVDLYQEVLDAIMYAGQIIIEQGEDKFGILGGLSHIAMLLGVYLGEMHKVSVVDDMQEAGEGAGQPDSEDNDSGGGPRIPGRPEGRAIRRPVWSTPGCATESLWLREGGDMGDECCSVQAVEESEAEGVRG